jgi:hypothetical protein
MVAEQTLNNVTTLKFIPFFVEPEGQVQWKEWLTPERRILLERLTTLQPIKKLLAFHGTVRSLPYSQEPVTCPCPEPDESSLHFPPHYLRPT